MKNPIPSRLRLLAALIVAAIASSAFAQPIRSIDLAGTCRFQLDPEDAGIDEHWFHTRLQASLQLPGSLQEQGFGEPPSIETTWMGGLNDRSFFSDERYAPYRTQENFKFPYWLTPTRAYTGAAWFQRDVTIPRSWQGRRIVLQLERPHWETRLWVDHQACGSNNSLAAPHEYDLSAVLTPGTHTLTIRVDNRLIIPVGENSHSVSDHTQGNWNGLTGSLKLTASSPVYLEQLQVHPELAAEAVTIKGVIHGVTPAISKAELGFRVDQAAGFEQPQTVASGELAIDPVTDQSAFQIRLPIEHPRAWDEFDPALYRLTVTLGHEQLQQVTFGMREVAVDGTQIVLNGRRLFLRGTLECCIFPLTGYPPTQVEPWRRIMRIARAHGLNHLRFHSWTPPEAAFQAADELGFYLYVECPTWANGSTSVGDGRSVDDWIYAEGDRILEHYGNHPSFIMMSYGNEPGGNNQQRWLGDLVNSWKAKDPRRLYTSGAGWPMIPENDFHVTHQARGFPVRAELGETAGDYSGFLAGQDKPIVSHEIGQYCVFPNLEEIPQYTGWLKAANFEIVRDFLDAKGLLDQAPDFLRASGKLQTLFYKDEIEACLRTPGWAGFELLDLHDFPGQGTALVGVLDPFWNEKGYVTPEAFRRFCDETVPLARLPKRIWTLSERLDVPVDIAHFGPTDLPDTSAHWVLRTASGTVRAEGTLGPVSLTTGGLTRIGEISLPLTPLEAPAALNLEVRLGEAGEAPVNDWNLWLYPDPAEAGPNQDELLIARELDQPTLDALNAGRRVLLLADPRTIASDTVGRFDPIFWNTMWFPTQPQHTLGLLLDPDHPAFAAFPTEFHSDWQWRDIHNNAKPMVLDSLPSALTPICQVIDDWNTCRKLGLLIEAKVGSGRLLLCSADLTSNLDTRPEARQLRASLERYAAGPAFDPQVALTPDQLQSLFRQPRAIDRLHARIVDCSSAHPGYPADLILDGDPKTMWHTPWGENAPGFPHTLVIALDAVTPLRGLELTPRNDNNRNGWIREYTVELSRDGEQWTEAASGSLSNDARVKQVLFSSGVAEARFIRLIARSGFTPDAPFASLAELDLLFRPEAGSLTP